MTEPARFNIDENCPAEFVAMLESEPLAGWLWIVEEAGVRFRAG